MNGGSEEDDDDEQVCQLEVKRHSAFWLRHLRLLPTQYTGTDVQRMTLAYFCLGALDLLDLVEGKVPKEERVEYIDWIYDQQISSTEGGGFVPGPFLRRRRRASDTDQTNASSSKQQTICPPVVPKGNLAMTYTAVINLAILQDDFSRLDVASIRTHLSSLQQQDGSFASSVGQTEFDCRFVYCAFAVCEMLNVWDAIDVDQAVHFLLASQSYDGAFGQAPGQESHGGSTYCAIAALALSKKLHVLDEHGADGTARIRQWLVHRQQSTQGGFNGRLEKVEDACYSFWCGASLAILASHSLIDARADVKWLLSCQTNVGGIAKTPDDLPDVMHSYLSLAALSIDAYDECEEAQTAAQASLKPLLKQLDPRLNVSLAALTHLRRFFPQGSKS